MKNKYLSLFLIAGALIALSGCSSASQQLPANQQSSAAATTDTVSAPSSTTVVVPATPSTETAQVAISNFSFNPAQLTIKKGTVVTWTNQDPMSHTVTSQGLFDSGPISSNSIYSFKFDNAGTFDYACTIHPSMKGTITVQ